MSPPGDSETPGPPVTSEGLDDLPFTYEREPAQPFPPTPRKCGHPKYRRTKADGIESCSCGHVFDPANQRRGRTNRARGNAEELTVARRVGGRKMGPVGLPWDVEMPGYARLQVRKYANPQSLRRIAAELDRIGYGPEMPGYVWIEPGRQPIKLIIFALDPYADRHGVNVEDPE